MKNYIPIFLSLLLFQTLESSCGTPTSDISLAKSLCKNLEKNKKTLKELIQRIYQSNSVEDEISDEVAEKFCLNSSNAKLEAQDFKNQLNDYFDSYENSSQITKNDLCQTQCHENKPLPSFFKGVGDFLIPAKSLPLSSQCHCLKKNAPLISQDIKDGLKKELKEHIKETFQDELRGVMEDLFTQASDDKQVPISCKKAFEKIHPGKVSSAYLDFKKTVEKITVRCDSEEGERIQRDYFLSSYNASPLTHLDAHGPATTVKDMDKFLADLKRIKKSPCWKGGASVLSRLESCLSGNNGRQAQDLLGKAKLLSVIHPFFKQALLLSPENLRKYVKTVEGKTDKAGSIDLSKDIIRKRCEDIGKKAESISSLVKRLSQLDKDGKPESQDRELGSLLQSFFKRQRLKNMNGHNSGSAHNAYLLTSHAYCKIQQERKGGPDSLEDLDFFRKSAYAIAHAENQSQERALNQGFCSGGPSPPVTPSPLYYQALSYCKSPESFQHQPFSPTARKCAVGIDCPVNIPKNPEEQGEDIFTSLRKALHNLKRTAQGKTSNKNMAQFVDTGKKLYESKGKASSDKTQKEVKKLEESLEKKEEKLKRTSPSHPSYDALKKEIEALRKTIEELRKKKEEDKGDKENSSSSDAPRSASKKPSHHGENGPTKQSNANHSRSSSQTMGRSGRPDGMSSLPRTSDRLYQSIDKLPYSSRQEVQGILGNAPMDMDSIVITLDPKDFSQGKLNNLEDHLGNLSKKQVQQIKQALITKKDIIFEVPSEKGAKEKKITYGTDQYKKIAQKFKDDLIVVKKVLKKNPRKTQADKEVIKELKENYKTLLERSKGFL